MKRRKRKPQTKEPLFLKLKGLVAEAKRLGKRDTVDRKLLLSVRQELLTLKDQLEAKQSEVNEDIKKARKTSVAIHAYAKASQLRSPSNHR